MENEYSLSYTQQHPLDFSDSDKDESNEHFCTIFQ